MKIWLQAEPPQPRRCGPRAVGTEAAVLKAFDQELSWCRPTLFIVDDAIDCRTNEVEYGAVFERNVSPQERSAHDHPFRYESVSLTGLPFETRVLKIDVGAHMSGYEIDFAVGLECTSLNRSEARGDRYRHYIARDGRAYGAEG